MKLYLSSYRIPNIAALQDLLGTDFSNVRVALVPNAGDYYADRARAIKIRDNITNLKSIGFNRVEAVDLQEYRDKDILKKVLSDFDLIRVSGGNTFCLREEMRKSGFEDIIHELLDSGIVYAGESAGALAAGNSLKGIEAADNPEFAEQIIWEGLNIIPNFVLPHVGSDYFGEAVEKAKLAHQENPSEIIELTDQQALIIDGDKNEIVEGTDNETL